VAVIAVALVVPVVTLAVLVVAPPVIAGRLRLLR
jgi:hypothetical protein